VGKYFYLKINKNINKHVILYYIILVLKYYKYNMTKGHDYTDKRTGIVYTNVIPPHQAPPAAQLQQQLDAFISEAFLTHYFEKLGTNSI